MKPFCYLLLPLLLLSACSSPNRAVIDLTTLSGEWTREGYRQQLAASRSPLKASKALLYGKSAVTIRTFPDSAAVLILINNHEGITGHLKTDRVGQTPNSARFVADDPTEESYDLSLDTTTGKPILLLVTYNPQGEKVASDRFERVTSTVERNDPCSVAAIRVLLQGRWTVKPIGSKTPLQITIDSCGTLSGWNGYQTVSVATDAVFGGEDEITLNGSPSQTPFLRMVAVFDPAQIRLFEALEDPDGSPVERRGKELYTLTRP